MPGGPSIKVITTITTATGVRLEPATELRIGEGLAAEAVTGDGPTRIVLTGAPVPTTTPQSIVPQASVLAAGPATVRFVIAAATAVALPITRIEFIPHAATAQSDIDYARFTVAEYNSLGAFTRFVVDGYYGTNVQDFDSMARNVWFLLTSYTCPLGSTVVVEWSKIGSGADVLGGTWIIT